MISLVSVKDLEEGTSKGIEYDNKYVFAVRKDNLFHVYWNICPHLGTPLEWEEDQFLWWTVMILMHTQFLRPLQILVQ